MLVETLFVSKGDINRRRLLTTFESRRVTGRQTAVRAAERFPEATGKWLQEAPWHVSEIRLAAAPAQILLRQRSRARGTRRCRAQRRLPAPPEPRSLQNHRMEKFPMADSGIPIVVLHRLLTTK